MEKARLGKTGLMVSRIGFGALPIQSVDRESAEKVVRHAFSRGINFFDTARAYSTSEADLGRALGGLEDQVIVATKSFYRNMGQLEEDFETSFTNLKRSYIDLFQFHMVNTEEELEEILKKGGPLDYIESRRRKGCLRHIGITSHRPEVMLKALDTNSFETVQVPFNYIEHEPLEKLFPLARQKDVGIIAMKPVAGGVFTTNRAAIKWTLQHHGVVPIPGMCRLEEVDENLQALEAPLSPDELAGLETDWRELGNNFCRRCEYCLPCPNEIKPSFIVRADLLYKRVGWDKMEQSHIDAFTGGLTCDRCGTCESRCPYRLPLSELVIEKSKAMLQKAVEMGMITEEQLQEKLRRAEKEK